MFTFPGPALISLVVCNVLALHGSIWLSALRQPAHQHAAPKCHTPSPCWPPVLRQSAIHCGMRSLCKRLSRWAVAQVPPAISSSWHVRHNSSQSHKRELARATAKHRSPSRHGPLVLIGRAFAPQPNFAVKWDADKLHRFGNALWAPLTLALGFPIFLCPAHRYEHAKASPTVYLVGTVRPSYGRTCTSYSHSGQPTSTPVVHVGYTLAIDHHCRGRCTSPTDRRTTICSHSTYILVRDDSYMRRHRSRITRPWLVRAHRSIV